MPYIKRTTRIGETVETEYFYTAGKHNSAAARKRRRKIQQPLKTCENKDHRSNDYYALMYRTKGTDGAYRYVSRLKGQFNIPDETNATEDNGTGTNNTQIQYTGIYTEHEFTKGKATATGWEKASAKSIIVDTRYNKVDVSCVSFALTPSALSAQSFILLATDLNSAFASLICLLASVIPLLSSDISTLNFVVVSLFFLLGIELLL